MSENAKADPIRLPDEPRESDAIVIRQQTIYYFLVGVVFFAAGFIVAWVTFTTTTAGTNAADIRSAASAGAREAVRAEMQSLQSTVVAQVGQINISGGAGASAETVATPSGPVNVELGDAPIWGSETAKVTIVEFSDFECFYCARFYSETYGRLKAEFGDQVRFAYKHFPISFAHPQAESAAMASVCANEQGKFWEYHDLLFPNQANLGRDALVSYAQKAGVSNMEQFTQCVDSQKYAATVQADLAQGEKLGVTGTPTFFINGRPLVGAQPYDVFAFAIEQALREAGVN